MLPLMLRLFKHTFNSGQGANWIKSLLRAQTADMPKIFCGNSGRNDWEDFCSCGTIQERYVGPHNIRNSFDSNRNMMGAGFRHNEKSGRKETLLISLNQSLRYKETINRPIKIVYLFFSWPEKKLSLFTLSYFFKGYKHHNAPQVLSIQTLERTQVSNMQIYYFCQNIC